ncbi:SWI/SNF and RSC complexes subunit arp9 [Hypsizygus marmoreus]|uniref:SWI/SNF and RSC complexes subunit arp9 n=1 Tax=Hypsizygus marmoreus TaxID=39966 RepID=A0A369JQQ4_HYPMA|nr:SWI/SNF and RSC complexes subunit arp9 [Hypsizygus marmoreus]
MSFRDSIVVIIETSRTHIRAGLGLHDLLKTPAVEIQARVGLRRNASGEHLNRAQQPIAPGNNAAKPAVASSSRMSSLPQDYEPNASVNDYLVGTALDEALAAGQDVSISWPFADGDVRDWTQAEAIWKYILFNQLQRRRLQNESPVLLSIFPGLARDTYERTCQVFFERFNTAGFAIIERPIAQLYAANSLSGVVVDVGEEKTDVTPISDGFIIHHARKTTSLGARDCKNYLARLLQSNQGVVSALSPPDKPLDPQMLNATLLELVNQVWTDGHVKVPTSGETALIEDEGVTDIAAVLVAGKEKAVIESGMKKKATAKASAAEQARAREIEAMDLLTVQFREHSLTLGKERHRFCEPLFDPTLLKGLPRDSVSRTEQVLSLQEAVGLAVAQADIDQRQSLWAGLFVTGDVTRYVKGIGVALQSRVAPYIANSDLQSDVQPRYARALSVPEYYPEYRDTGNGLACFLGSSITAKIIFSDSGGRNFVTKADYTARGPHSIIETTPALL